MQDFHRALDNDHLSQQVMALAMTLNACIQVNKLAQDQDILPTATPAYVTAALNTNPKSYSELFTCPDTMQSALGALIILLKGQHNYGDALPKQHQVLFDTRYLRQVIVYVHGVLKLRKTLLKDPKKSTELENRLHIIARFQQLQSDSDGAAFQQVMTKMATLYLDIFGTMSFRIIIQGKQDALEQPGTVEQVRCLLLGAIRFSVLWHQVGGRQWKLLLTRGKMLAAAESLYGQLEKAKSSPTSNVIKIKP